MEPQHPDDHDLVDLRDEPEFTSENEPGPGDSVMGMIAGVEERISQLKRMHDEHRKATEQLDAERRAFEAEREQVVSDREHLEQLAKELADREESTAQREQTFEAQREEVEAKLRELSDREARFEAQESETRNLADRLERERSELQERMTRVQAEADARWARIDERQARLEDLQSGIDERLEEAQRRDAELIERESKLREMNVSSDRVEELENRLQQREKIVAELRDQAEKSDAELVAARDAMLRAGGATEQLGEARRECAELREQVKDLNAQLDRATGGNEELEESRERIDHLEAELEVAQAKVTQTSESAAEKVATERENSDRLRAELIELAEARDEAQSAAAATTERIEHLEQMLAEAREELESVSAARATDASNTGELQQQLETVTRRAEDAEALAERLREAGEREGSEQSVQLESVQAELESTARDLQSERERSGQLESRIAELEGNEQAAELQLRIETLEQELQASRETLERAERVDEARAAEDASTIEKLTNRLRERDAQREELQRKLAEAEVRPRDDREVGNRRDRLRKQRALLRDRSTKLNTATKALRDRFEQVEQILSRRAELAEAYQSVADAEAKLANRESRSAAMLMLTAIVVIFGVLGGASWFVSGVMAPGQHAATAVVRADAGSRQLTESDLQGWRAYVDGLTADPAFLESVAERMKRRGIESYSTAGALRSMVASNLDVQSPEQGTIEFELRDSGRARTERVLDTYVVALASQANHNRSRRSDGATTVVGQASRVRSDPLDQTRLVTAGGMFGGTALLTLVGGNLIWRRMRDSKAKFERSARVDMILDEARWGDPREDAA